eukprot:CAMPEP_0174237598 /NCGR_PEP_ID=MMETSP0417-20130205/8589_1 /TAXON_ID=242541 /ORGANISM="Mayorella sp, Strain BSH-02190019" /LENGTH=221 /DNA_ID=CAMNT_0015316371 /DNA_START=54 /DNA_END=716 /DNA_ORIENTATION=-
MAHIKSTSTHWGGEFNEIAYTGKGDGVYCEGRVVDVRFHSVNGTRDIHRYIAVRLDLLLARKRVFDARHVELQPHWKRVEQLRKEYAAGSFKVEKETDPIPVSLDEVLDIFGDESGAALPPKFGDAATMKTLHPHVKGRFEVWGSADRLKSLHLKPGDEVAFWTDGDSCIVQGMRSSSASEFEGKQGAEVMEGWGKKLDSAVDESTPLPGDALEGCDEDEW